MFTDAFEKWQSEGAPEKEKLNKYETVFEFLVKEEVDLVERRFFPPQLMDEVVTVITCIDWENAPKNISLRALTRLLKICYKRRLLVTSDSEENLSLELKSFGKEHVEEHLLPRLKSIYILSWGRTLHYELRLNCNSLNKKIKCLFPTVEVRYI